MNCPHCGRDLRDGDRFCPSCGKPVTTPDPKPEQNPDPAPENPGTPADPGIPADPGMNSGRNDYVLPDGAAPIPDPRNRPSRAAAALKAIAAVVLYLFLFVGIQSCVIGNYAASRMDTGALAIAAQNAADDPEAFQSAFAEIMRQTLDAVMEKQALLTLISSLLTILVICLLFRLRRRRPLEEFALYPVNPRRLIQFALLGTALNVFLSVGLSLIPLPEELFEMQEMQYAGILEGNLFVSLLSVGIVGPITEEIVFRGIPMTRLGPAIGGWGAVFVSSLLFGLAHGTPLAIGYAFLIGMVFAAIYLRYGTILPGIVCHCFFNLTSFWLGGSEVTAWQIALLAASVLILGWTWISAVIRYPRFDDVLYDRAGRIRSEDPRKQAIIEECRRIRTEGGAEMAEIRELAEKWDQINRNQQGQDK